MLTSSLCLGLGLGPVILRTAQSQLQCVRSLECAGLQRCVLARELSQGVYYLSSKPV